MSLDYKNILIEAETILTEKWYSNLSNMSALLMNRLPDLNWAGFYLAEGKNLFLGPFQGQPACLYIPFGKGVCGTAASKRETLLVPDVHLFEGHIACDARSQSEVVVPLILNERVLGVMDLDSPTKNRFDEDDREGLISLSRLLIRKTSWPSSF
jgi:GAF domain-containing protein